MGRASGGYVGTMDSALPAPMGSAFAHRDFRLYQAARLFMTLGAQMLSVAVGLHVYGMTHRPLDLGYVGLAQFLPMFLLSPITGDVADRYDRRKVLLGCYVTMVVAMLGLFGLAWGGVTETWPLYGMLMLVGVARAFAGPAGQSLVPHMVPPHQLSSAVAWSSTFFQAGTIIGPSVGGVLYDVLHAQGVYAVCAGLMAAAALLLASMRVHTGRMDPAVNSWQRLLAGLRYVWKQKVVLGAISLDLFAVLLGGAVALLPIYAQDILHTGPWGLGLLRSAPAVGAILVAGWMAFFPLQRNVGVKMLLCVALFGVATVLFGLSRHLVLSLVALVVLGAADMVSVVIRQTLVQLATPAEMRGRVSAVNMVFIGASNELGDFESGATAQWLGVVPSVVVGGVGTCVVVALWAWLFPALLRISRTDEVRPLRG
ncbi:Predicted arabinose efflux permease, MFS family [Stigmatella aurantiaca]|uniref:Multidrug efflux pump Tap n=2 Tax=Stigmatella aurantiaca TaxID=41 RepID=A0A1H7Y3C9_STIAU|nr:Predicted arabinose efflux permease, MFS family [Stigmatella aurantiaca]